MFGKKKKEELKSEIGKILVGGSSIYGDWQEYQNEFSRSFKINI